MRKNIFGVALYALLLPLCFSAQAQQPAGKVPRIGFLHTGSASDPVNSRRLDVFRQSLRDLGYIEGKNINIEYRYGEGKSERLQQLAEELVRFNVDILVASTATAARSMRKATTTIPIVVANMGSLTGLVDSLARPGGNVTGLTHISSELLGKRLELLKEVLPKVSRFVFLNDTTGAAATNVWPRKRKCSESLRRSATSSRSQSPQFRYRGRIPNDGQGAHWRVHHRVDSAYKFSQKKDISVSRTKSSPGDAFGGRMGELWWSHVLRGEPS
jgi:putative ABC transport system substrate-binding protein